MGMGMGVGMGAGAGMGNLMAGMMGQVGGGRQPQSAPAQGTSCPACRSDNQPGARFCASCGKPMGAMKCSKCQTELAAGVRFCSSCGEKIGA